MVRITRYKQPMKRGVGLGDPMALPSYLTAMVRRRPPEFSCVIAGSTPVIAFGNPEKAWAASLGINPSRREFVDDDGTLLGGGRRRLATLRSLGAASLEALTDEQVATVAADCAAYFRRRPYRLWFDPLDQLLRAGIGASYSDGTACHLDLVQWATDPVWALIDGKSIRQALIEDGLPHLRAQLAANPQISVVLCNGRQVIDQVIRAGLADLRLAGLLRSGAVKCELYAGRADGRGSQACWLAWSANLQSGWGVSTALKQQLSDWLASAYVDFGPPSTPASPTLVGPQVPVGREPTSCLMPIPSARPSRHSCALQLPIPNVPGSS